MKPLRLANVRNGLAYPHDDLCYFQSQHAHHAGEGYFRIDAMPLTAVRHLLLGGQLVIVDATRHPDRLSDALRFGVPTWCAVFNRAIGQRVRPCDWWTREMQSVADWTHQRPVVQTIRKLAELYACAYTRPAVIGKSILLECHGGVDFDDRVAELRRWVGAPVGAGAVGRGATPRSPEG